MPATCARTPTPTAGRAAVYDAIVVGARAAGAATALQLARRGHRVLVVDRARYGSDTLSTHALMRGAVLQLHRWGLLDRIAAAGTPAVRRVVFHLADGDVHVPLKPVAGTDALYAPRRTLLDRVLVDAAVEAGAEVRFGVTVTDVARQPTGRVVGIHARNAAGAGFTAHGRLTIGADGVRSLVARRVGAAVERAGTAAGAVVYGYFPGVGTDAYEWFWTPGATAGVIPTNDGAAVVFAGAPSERFRRDVAGDLAGGLRRILADASSALADRLAGVDPVSPLRGFPGVPGFVRRSWGPGWALVGDAGHFKDPLGAHGITDALRDAEGLAIAADAALTGAGAEAAALAGYQRERDELSAALFEVTDELAAYRWDADTVRPLLESLSAAMRPEIGAILGRDIPERHDPALPRSA